MKSYDYVFIGLSLTSSWGNGHAVTYRSLLRELSARGHRILFLERNTPWYESNRDLPVPPYCTVALYSSVEELKERFVLNVRDADLVIVGSFVQDGIEIGEWVVETASNPPAFYDIDTPVTLTGMISGTCGYMNTQLIRAYGLYLSFSGGEILDRLRNVYGARMVYPLYCSVDPALYSPLECEPAFDLGYMGTWSRDRQPVLERLMLEAAGLWPKGRFVVAGPQYPDDIFWPRNIVRMDHVPPSGHRSFYTGQRFTLNVTRSDMKTAGFSPSVRLFEAAACGVPVISDYWKGLDTFFDLQREILISRSPAETLQYLRSMPESNRIKIGRKARERVLIHHTASRRAEELEAVTREYLDMKPKKITFQTGTAARDTPSGFALKLPLGLNYT